MANYSFTNAIFRNVGVSEQVVYTPPGGKKSIVLQLDIANVTNGDVHATYYIKRSGTAYNGAKTALIGAGTTLQAIYGQRMVLLDGDSLCVVSDTATSLDITCSLLEDV